MGVVWKNIYILYEMFLKINLWLFKGKPFNLLKLIMLSYGLVKEFAGAIIEGHKDIQ